MVTMTSDFNKAFEMMLERWAERIRLFRSRRWWKKTRLLGRYEKSDQVFTCVYIKRWLPAPCKETIAALADRIEAEDDPELLQGFAALVQRASIIEPEVRGSVMELASSVEALGFIEPGCTSQALQAQTELDQLLSAAVSTWSSVDEVLGEDHCHPAELLNLAWSHFVMSKPDGPWSNLLVVIERLRKATFRLLLEDPSLTDRERKRWVLSHSLLDLLSLAAWTEYSGVDLAALQECLRCAREEGESRC